VTRRPASVIGTAGLVLTPGDPRVMVGGRRIILRPQELALLELLVRDRGRLVKTATLAECLGRGRKPLNKTTVAVHVHRLRKRLQNTGLTVRGFRGAGYTVEAVEEREGG
jgi:two-component system OmpR family response regulator